MSRVQLALNVSDVEAAVGYYSMLFGVGPAKRRPGYANFAVESPPLKLVLIENPSAAGSLNHLGVEVDSLDEVREAAFQLESQGAPIAVEEGVECCFAVQDKVWSHAPDGEAWEIYTVVDDTPTSDDDAPTGQSSGQCCTPAMPTRVG